MSPATSCCSIAAAARACASRASPFSRARIDRPQEDLARVVDAAAGNAAYVPLVMAEDLTLDQVARMEAASLEHPEFEIEVRQRRFYRHGTQTAHVVGYLGEANERALNQRSDLHAGDLVGVKGVEQTYDSILRGVDGRRVVVVDSRGKFVHEELRQPSHPGANLELTLDLELQQEAERFFADKVGSAVALDPRNGEILAMVSAPSFNPNVFARRIEHSDWRAIVDAPHQPLQNRAMQNTYPPGSVFKIVTAIAALEQGTVHPNDAVSCSGATRVFNHTFRCWKRGGHGRVDLRRAIAQSCDVYFYHLGARLTIDPIASWSKRLGLGEVTGLDLVGEKAGLVPDREWSLRQRGTMWFPGETVSVSIGQGPLLVTPLQVAVMMATVANGGHVVQPHLSRSLAAAARSRGRRVGGDARLRQGRARRRGQRRRHRRARAPGHDSRRRQDRHGAGDQPGDAHRLGAARVRAPRSRLVRLVRSGRGPSPGGGRVRRARRPRLRCGGAARQAPL